MTVTTALAYNRALEGVLAMDQVYRVMLRCPTTTRTVDTGIRTSGREALNSTIYQDGRLMCPYCGQLHSYEVNAFFEIDPAELANGLWRPNS